MSPSCSPSITAISLTELAPNITFTRSANWPSSTSLNMTHALIRLTVYGTSDVRHVVQPLGHHISVDTRVRTSAPRKVGRKRNVYGHGAVLHRRIDAHYLPHDRVVSCVDVRDLSHCDVLGLCLGNPDLGLEAPRLHDPGQRLAGLDPLAFIER